MVLGKEMLSGGCTENDKAQKHQMAVMPAQRSGFFSLMNQVRMPVKLKRKYLSDVYVEHPHFLDNKLLQSMVSPKLAKFPDLSPSIRQGKSLCFHS